MRVEQDQARRYEGQLYAIPHWAAGRRGALLDWGMRLVGLAGMLSILYYWLAEVQATNAVATFGFVCVFGGWVLFYESWTVRCYRFGWPKVWMSTGMAMSNKARERLIDPATGEPFPDDGWLPGMFTPGRKIRNEQPAPHATH